MRYKLLLISILIFSFFSCNVDNNIVDKRTYDLDNINNKEVDIYADEYSQSLLNQLGIVFKNYFDSASINVNYKSDSEVMGAMLKDSIRLVVLMRDLSEYEINELIRLHEAKPISHTFAYNAIALVKDNFSADTIIDSLHLVNQLTNAEDVFVTTNEYVELFQLLLKKLKIKGDKHPLKIVKNLEELQHYLASDSKYIGLLPFSLVSDQYDSESKQITKKFRWLGIQNSEKDTVYPSQSTIFTKEWPLVIPYNIMYCNLSANEGIGFVKFIHTKQAARLILKAGLIPYTLPDRDVKIEPQSFEL